jgi:hypothetical protein
MPARRGVTCRAEKAWGGPARTLARNLTALEPDQKSQRHNAGLEIKVKIHEKAMNILLARLSNSTARRALVEWLVAARHKRANFLVSLASPLSPGNGQQQKTQQTPCPNQPWMSCRRNFRASPILPKEWQQDISMPRPDLLTWH